MNFHENGNMDCHHHHYTILVSPSDLFFLCCSSKCGSPSGFCLRPFSFLMVHTLSHGDVIYWPGFISTCLLGTHCRQDFLWAPHLYTQLPPGEALWLSLKHLSLYMPQRKLSIFSIFSKLVLLFWISYPCGGPIQSPGQKPGRFLDPPHLGTNLETSPGLTSSSLILLPHCFWSILSTSIEFLISVTILCFLFDSFKKWTPPFC